MVIGMHMASLFSGFIIGIVAYGIYFANFMRYRRKASEEHLIISICSYLEEKYDNPQRSAIGYEIFGAKFNAIYKEYLSYGWNK